MILDDYRQFGGRNCDTAGLRNLLDYHGVVSPVTGKPFTEAMILGIAGGIGGGYFLFQFGGHANAALGTRHLWESPKKFVEGACKRLGVKVTCKETAGSKTAAAHLNAALANGHPAMAAVDAQKFSYEPEGYMYHAVVVYGVDEAQDRVWLSDRAAQPLTVTLSELAEARGRVKSAKNRLVTIEAPKGAIHLESAVHDGIRVCCESFLKPRGSNFGLTAIGKWAEAVNNGKDKRGWPNIFRPDRQFYETQKWCFGFIETYNTPGSGYRTMYAEFLENAAEILGKRALRDAAEQYRALGKQWTRTAEALLPDSVPLFKQTKGLMRKRREGFAKDGAKASLKPSQALAELRAEATKSYPIKEPAMRELLAGLATETTALYKGEKAAIEFLKNSCTQ